MNEHNEGACCQFFEVYRGALEFASERLKNNETIVLEAVKKIG